MDRCQMSKTNKISTNIPEANLQVTFCILKTRHQNSMNINKSCKTWKSHIPTQQTFQASANFHIPSIGEKCEVSRKDITITNVHMFFGSTTHWYQHQQNIMDPTYLIPAPFSTQMMFLLHISTCRLHRKSAVPLEQ